jgi:hypothetical protein
MDFLDRSLVPTTIRKWAFDLLPELCDLMATERGGEPINKSDALSVAVREALERRKSPDVSQAGAQLAEALRRYNIHESFMGFEELCQEFGAPEHPESSISMEAWLGRVLREPARAALAAWEQAGGKK